MANTKKTTTPVKEPEMEFADTPTAENAVKPVQNAPQSTETPKTVKHASKTETTVPGLSDDELAAQLLAGSSPEPNTANAGAGGRMTIDESLHQYFSPTDLVTIKNPFNFDTGWVYSDPKDIKIEQPTPETRRVYGIGRDYQKTRILRAGKSIIVQGWEAYVGLTRFFKQWVQTSYTDNSMASAMNNPLVFKSFMEKVFGGVYDPNAESSVVDSETAARAELERDLGLTNGGN